MAKAAARRWVAAKTAPLCHRIFSRARSRHRRCCRRNAARPTPGSTVRSRFSSGGAPGRPTTTPTHLYGCGRRGEPPCRASRRSTGGSRAAEEREKETPLRRCPGTQSPPRALSGHCPLARPSQFGGGGGDKESGCQFFGLGAAITLRVAGGERGGLAVGGSGHVGRCKSGSPLGSGVCAGGPCTAVREGCRHAQQSEQRGACARAAAPPLKGPLSPHGTPACHVRQCVPRWQ